VLNSPQFLERQPCIPALGRVGRNKFLSAVAKWLLLLRGSCDEPVKYMQMDACGPAAVAAFEFTFFSIITIVGSLSIVSRACSAQRFGSICICGGSSNMQRSEACVVESINKRAVISHEHLNYAPSGLDLLELWNFITISLF